ncbi:MAG: hypothetical protein ACO29O_02275, partial [Chitinophagaceae bacterium]
MKIKTIIFFCSFFSYVYMNAQESSLLYAGKIPGSIEGPNLETTSNNGVTIVAKISIPTITAYIPENASKNKSAIIIFPG